MDKPLWDLRRVCEGWNSMSYGGAEIERQICGIFQNKISE